jgi:hypothetical protein
VSVELEAKLEREGRKQDEADLMWLVLGAIHNVLADNGRCEIMSGTPTAHIIAEIVNRVEGRA